MSSRPHTRALALLSHPSDEHSHFPTGPGSFKSVRLFRNEGLSTGCAFWKGRINALGIDHSITGSVTMLRSISADSPIQTPLTSMLALPPELDL